MRFIKFLYWKIAYVFHYMFRYRPAKKVLDHGYKIIIPVEMRNTEEFDNWFIKRGYKNHKKWNKVYYGILVDETFEMYFFRRYKKLYMDFKLRFG